MSLHPCQTGSFAHNMLYNYISADRLWQYAQSTTDSASAQNTISITTLSHPHSHPYYYLYPTIHMHTQPTSQNSVVILQTSSSRSHQTPDRAVQTVSTSGEVLPHGGCSSHHFSCNKTTSYWWVWPSLVELLLSNEVFVLRVSLLEQFTCYLCFWTM